MIERNALKIKVERDNGDVEEQNARATETGEVLSEIVNDLQHAFASTYASVFLLFERGNLLDDLEKKSEKLAEQGERFNARTSCWSTTWHTLRAWVTGGCKWVWETRFCLALRADPSMNRPLKLIQ